MNAPTRVLVYVSRNLSESWEEVVLELQSPGLTMQPKLTVVEAVKGEGSDR